MIGLAGELDVGRGTAVRWKVMKTASPTAHNHKDDPFFSVHGFFGYTFLKL